MRHFAVAVLAVSIASAAMAEMTPGFVVTSGAPFPIVADFNGDGLDDLIQERNAVINSGGALATVHDFGIPADERVVGVLDVNGDHRLDLVTVGVPVVVPPSIQQEPAPMQSPGYRLYIADASRNYPAGIGVSSGPRPYAADVDSDGKDDFVILADVSNAQRLHIATDVIVLRSRGDGTFESLAPFRIGADVQIYPDHRIQSGDLNHDGAADLVLRTTQELISLLGTGDGHFSVKSRYLPMNQEFGVQTMRLGDIDGDSNLDVVVPGFRSVRALFGDGRGNFTRTARGRFEKVHDATGYPAGLALTPDNANQPKNFVLGHFTRGDQLQIAAGTGEGDIVILEYGTGALREVSRTATEFWLVSLRAGAFHAGGGTDLYAVGTLIWGENWPKPRLFYGVPDATAAGMVTRGVAGRRRSASMSPGTTLRMQMQADCVEPQAAERWSFTREGIFGVAQRGGTTIDGGTTIEAVFDDGQIYYRMNAPFAGETVFGVLDEANGSYSGTANVLTSCGWKVMTVNAKFE